MWANLWVSRQAWANHLRAVWLMWKCNEKGPNPLWLKVEPLSHPRWGEEGAVGRAGRRVALNSTHRATVVLCVDVGCRSCAAVHVLGGGGQAWRPLPRTQYITHNAMGTDRKSRTRSLPKAKGGLHHTTGHRGPAEMVSLAGGDCAIFTVWSCYITCHTVRRHVPKWETT